MARVQRELFSTTEQGNHPNVEAYEMQAGIFDGVTGGPTLEVLTPLAFNTSVNQWVVFDADGTNGTDTVRGFVYPEPVTLDATDEVQGQILTSGRVDWNDVVKAVAGSYNEAELTAELQANAHGRGLFIKNLGGVR